MSDVQRIVIQTRAPKGNDPGKVAEGWYCIADGAVVLTDAAGKPVGSERHHLNPDGDARLVACRMLRRHQNAKSSSGDFNRPINYPKMGY
jgi:hypothetical protein